VFVGQRSEATPPRSARRSFSSKMTSVYSCPIHHGACPIHGSCEMTSVYSCPIHHGSCPIHGSCKSGAGRRLDATTFGGGCSVYATPRFHGPRRAGCEFRPRGPGCGRHLAPGTPPAPRSYSGGSCCLAAARRHADSVDAVLPFITALDVVPGPASPANGQLLLLLLSPDTSVFSALETFVIIALYKLTFTIPYYTVSRVLQSRVAR